MDKGNGYVHKYYGFYFRAKQGLSYEGRSPSNSNSLPGGKGLKGWGVVVSLIMIDHKTVYSWSVEIENIARIQLTCEVRLEELQ